MESGTRNLEAESIRSGAESTGGRVKLKTVTEIRRCSARDTFVTEIAHLVLNSLLDWEPVEELKPKGVMWSVLRLCVFRYEASSTVLYATRAMDRGSRQSRKDRITVVERRYIYRVNEVTRFTITTTKYRIIPFWRH